MAEGFGFPVIPNYPALGYLGGGEYGEVIRARDELNNNRVVAIKWLTPAGHTEPKVIRMATSELRILGMVKDHANIAKFFGQINLDGHYFAILEYCPNGDLDGCILATRGEGLPEAKAYGYFHQLLAAVEFIHNRGIAHMDIKPANIVLDIHNQVKLTDFGMAIIDSVDKPLEQYRRCRGSPVYMAPEVAACRMAETRIAYSARGADLWSCGVTLFKMLFTTTPFIGATAQQVFDNLQMCEIQWPGGKVIPKEAHILLSRMFQRDPTRRYSMTQLRGIASMLTVRTRGAFPAMLSTFLQVSPDQLV